MEKPSLSKWLKYGILGLLIFLTVAAYIYIRNISFDDPKILIIVFILAIAWRAFLGLGNIYSWERWKHSKYRYRMRPPTISKK